MEIPLMMIGQWIRVKEIFSILPFLINMELIKEDQI